MSMIRGVVTNRQATYIRELLSGMTFQEIAERHQVTVDSVRSTIRLGIGGGYSGIELGDIPTSAFTAALVKFELQQGVGDAK